MAGLDVQRDSQDQLEYMWVCVGLCRGVRACGGVCDWTDWL